MPIEEFNPIFRPITTPVNLEVIGKAYDALEQGHLKTVETASAIESEIAKLDLNEAEDAWRQEQVNKIRSAVTDNSKYGNAYGALDNVIRANGSLMSNAGMIGRLRAQQDFKKYSDNLDKRTDIPEDYKAYFKEINTYNYKDIVDSKGNIIGGSKWEPTKHEVSTVPMNQILNQALSWAAKESGGGSQTRWLDENGKVTSDISKSVTGEIFSSTTGQWQKLSKEKLAQAVSAVIENTPGAKASLEQDYDIAKWKYDKSDGKNPDITDKNGILLTPEQYLAKRIDPFYKAATYFNQTSHTTYGNAWKAQLALSAQKSAEQQQGSGRIPDTLTTKTNPITIDNFMPADAQANITSSKQELANLLKASNPNLHFNLDNQADITTKRMIFAHIKDPKAKFRAYRCLEEIQDNQEYLNSIKQGNSKDNVDGFDAYNAIVTMSDLPNPNNNKYSKDYASQVNRIYGNNSKAVRQYFADDDIFDEFIAKIGGQKKAEALGVTFGNKDGKKYAELPREFNKSLYSFAKATSDAINSRSWLGEAWQSFKGSINKNWGDNVVRVNSKGEEEAIGNKTINGKIEAGGTAAQGDVFFNKLVSTVDGLKVKNDQVLKGGKLILGQTAVSQATPNAAEIAFMMKNNPEAAGKLSTAHKLETEEAKDAVRLLDLTQTGAYSVGSSNMYESLNSEDRKILTSRLRTAKNDDIDLMLLADPKTGRWGTAISIRGRENEGKKDYEAKTIFVPDAFDSSTIANWNNDTRFRAKNDVNLYSAAGRNISLTNVGSFGNVDKMIMKPIGNGFQVINKSSNKVIGNITPEQAVEFRDVYYQWNDTYNAIQSGYKVNPEAVNAIAKKAAAKLSQLNGYGENSQAANYYYQELISNLNK